MALGDFTQRLNINRFQSLSSPLVNSNVLPNTGATQGGLADFRVGPGSVWCPSGGSVDTPVDRDAAGVFRCASLEAPAHVCNRVCE